jgi:hypothetical protein
LKKYCFLGIIQEYERNEPPLISKAENRVVKKGAKKGEGNSGQGF